MNRIFKGLLASTAALALSGCITAKDLEGQINSRLAEADGAIEKDPCPEVDSAAAAHPALLSDASLKFNTPSTAAVAANLAVGAQMLSPSDGLTSQLSPSTVGYLGQLGFNAAVLDEFREDLGSIDATGAILPNQAMNTPAIAELMGDATTAALVGDPNTPQRVDMRVSSWRSTADDIAETTARNGWTAAFVESLGALRNANLTSANEDPALFADFVRKFLIAAYMKAYFRNGQILSVTFAEANTQKKLEEAILKWVSDPTSRAAVKDHVTDIAASVTAMLCPGETGKCLTLGSIGEETFVTRAGKSYGFPGISATFDPFAEKKVSTNKIDTEAVVTDLVRVVIEGTGDMLFHVPGSKNSTLCKALPARCQADDAQGKILAKVNDVGDRTEAAFMSITGIVIRGGWIFALNNETLAGAIQTGVSVTFRKAAEKAAWSRLGGRCDATRGGRGLAFSAGPKYVPIALSFAEPKAKD